MALHAIKAGEGDVFISAGVEMVSRFVKGNSDGLPDTHNPLFAEAEARTVDGRRAVERRRLARPARGRPVPRRRTSRWARPRRTSPALKGVTRQDMDEFGVRSQNLAEEAIKNGFWEREITPVTLPDGTVVSQGRRPARRRHPGGRRRA